MIYAYITVIYSTYFQVYYYRLLDHGLPKDVWIESVYIMIFLATSYVSLNVM